MTEIRVKVYGPAGEDYPGVAIVERRSEMEAFRRGGRKSLKIIGIIFGASLPFAFLDPFFFLLWGSILASVLLVIVGPYLHYRFADEVESFREVKAECPSCHATKKLEPYVSSKFEREFTVICATCGQTARVHAEIS